MAISSVSGSNYTIADLGGISGASPAISGDTASLSGFLQTLQSKLADGKNAGNLIDTTA